MHNPFDYRGKVALLTGAATGMGLATARAFAEEGAAVVLADYQEEAVKAAAQQLISAGHKAIHSNDYRQTQYLHDCWRQPDSEAARRAIEHAVALHERTLLVSTRTPSESRAFSIDLLLSHNFRNG